MKHDDAAAVVLVRAAEEVLPQTIPPDKLLDAHIAAGDPAEGAPWLARRARYLIANCLGPYTEMLPRLERRSSGWPFIALAAFAGLAANYLGPSTRIHVVWNPMMILIAWNFLVYTVLLISAAFSSPAEMPDPESSASPRQYRGFNSRIYRPGVVERIIFGPAISWLFAVKARVDEMRQDVVGFRKVAQRFAVLWWPLARPILHLWFRRTLHLSAIGIAVGAIIGMYVRGLFFDYNVIWQSTFVKDPESVAIILRYLLGPAAIVRGQPLPTADSVAPLFTPEGDDAASWIHLYAVSALLFIVIPRGFLALATTRQLSGQHRNVRLDLEVGYYAEVLERARNVRPKELEARVRGAVRDECLGVSHDFAEFVCRELYDARIAPRIVKFRETGGTLRALENELRLECQSFGAELHAQMAKAGQELERRVAVRVRELLGENEAVDTRPVDRLFREVSTASFALTHTGDRVSGDITTLMTSVVSGSVGIAIGTISGGFGEALGIALLVGVVESGPVGWVIGAIGGLVAAAGVLALGRERLREGVKEVPLPPMVLKIALWSSRYQRLIAEGRKRCEDSVRHSLADQLDQFSSSVGTQIWNRLRAVIGESQRPASTSTRTGQLWPTRL